VEWSRLPDGGRENVGGRGGGEKRLHYQRVEGDRKADH